MRRSLFLLVPLVLMGCDADGDGLTNSEEEELGTNPESADSDGDGADDNAEVNAGTDPLVQDTDNDRLLDGAELDLGTDPLVQDTDGDTYLDGWEVTEGTDPLDEDSRIYVGYWPYNPDKDGIDAPDYDSASRQLGESVPRFQLMDHNGDMVDMYDYHNIEGKYVLLDLSAVWCPPCNAFAGWLSGDERYASYDDEWPGLREKIDNGEVYFLTVLGEDRSGNVPDMEDLGNWHRQYSEKNSPIMTVDEDRVFTDFFLDVGWPSVYLLTPDLKFETLPDRDNPFAAFYAAAEL
ncbi:MAG: hypothetical protein AAFV53_42275 [Myxococcota bacterium]